MGVVLGARIRELRLAASLTLESSSAQAGVSTRTISNIERGAITAPQQHTLTALVRALGLGDEDRLEVLRLAREARSRPPAGRGSVMTPPYVSDFVGRAEELGVLHRLLHPDTTDRRPVGISGAAGVGKTSIALEALRLLQRSLSKQLFVDLKGMSERPLTPLEVLQSLLMQLAGPPPVPSTLDEAVVVWKAATRAESLTVLLDDAGSESQIRPALSCGSGLQVIVTGRRSLLGLEDFPRMSLRPFERADSTRLLTQVIPMTQRQDADLDELAEVCGDLPLALRIAGNLIAARPTLRVQDFVIRRAHANPPLDAFVAGDLAVHASLMRSYDQLDEAARSTFRSLSALEDSTITAALVAAANGLDLDAVHRQLDDLVDLGLVIDHGRGRHSLHPLVRLFAAQQAQRAHDDVDAVKRRTRGWLLDSATNAGRALGASMPRGEWRTGGRVFVDARDAREWLEDEAWHLVSAARDAFQQNAPDLLVRAADGLCIAFETLGHTDEWQQLHARCVVAHASQSAAGGVVSQHRYFPGAAVGWQELEGAYEARVAGWVYDRLSEFDDLGASARRAPDSAAPPTATRLQRGVAEPGGFDDLFGRGGQNIAP